MIQTLVLSLLIASGALGGGSSAHAMAPGRPAPKTLSGVYETRYTGPDLSAEANELVCPKQVIIEVRRGGDLIATPEDTTAIGSRTDEQLLAGSARKIEIQLRPMHGHAALSQFPAVEKFLRARSTSPIPGDAILEVASDTYTSDHRGRRSLNAVWTGRLGSEHHVQITHRFLQNGEVLTIESTVSDPDLRLELIQHGQFITHACELRKLN